MRDRCAKSAVAAFLLFAVVGCSGPATSDPEPTDTSQGPVEATVWMPAPPDGFTAEVTQVSSADWTTMAVSEPGCMVEATTGTLEAGVDAAAAAQDMLQTWTAGQGGLDGAIETQELDIWQSAGSNQSPAKAPFLIATSQGSEGLTTRTAIVTTTYPSYEGDLQSEYASFRLSCPDSEGLTSWDDVVASVRTIIAPSAE